MRTKLSILLLTFSSIIFAQTYRFIYHVEYKSDSSSLYNNKEYYHLDISGNNVDYYQRDFFIADSLINNNLPFPESTKLNTSTIISHQRGSYKFQTYDTLENTVLNLQTKDVQEWKLINEKKKTGELELHKAITSWGGRNWTAWFTFDIPFNEGPYKFSGLPGLIVELEDDNKLFSFSLIKSQNIKTTYRNQFIEIAKKMSVPVTWDKYKKIKLSYYNSPISFIKNSIGTSNNLQFFLNDGTLVNTHNMREINENIRKKIKKSNNPINLERYIDYP